MRTIVIGAALALGVSFAAQAANRHVDIKNDTGETLTEFYASVTKTDDWEEDILGDQVIEDGETFDINIDDGSGSCRYDFKAVFEGGDVMVRKNINVCEVATYTYTR